MNDTPLPLTVLAITARGFAVGGGRQRGQKGCGIVAVYHHHIKAKRAQAVIQGVKGDRLFGASALLQAVAVDDQRQVRQLVVARQGCGLPIRALLQLTVAGQHKGALTRPRDLARNGDACRHGQPMPQRAGVCFNAGQVVAVGVTVQPGPIGHIGFKPAFRKIPRR